MFSFKNYILLRESNEPKIPTFDEFRFNSTQQLEQLPFELYLHFAIQCAEKALPAYEKYTKNDPSVRQIIEAAKNGTVTHDLINKVSWNGQNAFNAGVAGSNMATHASQAAFAALHAGYAAIHGNAPPMVTHSFDYAMHSGEITEHEVYDIFVSLFKIKNIRIKTHGIRSHLPPILPAHIIQLVNVVKQDPSEDTPRMALADAIEEFEGEHNTTIDRHEFDTILAHLREKNVKWTSSDWVFRELLK